MQKLKFNIPMPCHKNWSSFTRTQQGAFCQFCEQEVIDFSEKTDEEILDFLKSGQFHTKLCAKVTERQLENGIRLNHQFVHFPKFVKRVATIALIGFSMTGTPVLVSGQTTVKGEVMDTIPKAKAKIIKIEVPATYQTYDVQKVKTPPKVIVHEVPAEYKEIKMKKQVRIGGFVEWREIDCIAPESEITIEIKLLKEKLSAKGYFHGTIDNIVTQELKTALIQFKKDNKLVPAFELDDDTMYLLGIESK